MAASPLQFRVALRWAGSTLVAETLGPGARVELSGLLPALAGEPPGLTRVEVGPDEAVVVLPRGDQERLREGEERSIELGQGLTLEAQAHREETRSLRAPGPSGLRWFVAGSLAVHAALGGACTLLTGAEVETREEKLERARGYLVRAELQARQITDEEPEDHWDTDHAFDTRGGTRTRCEEGTMSNPRTRPNSLEAKRQVGRSGSGIQESRDAFNPEAARQAALREAMEFGLIGLLHSGAGEVTPAAPSQPTRPGQGLAQRAASKNNQGGGPAAPDAARIAPWGLTEEIKVKATEAGERDDNARYRDFTSYLEKNRTPRHRVLDVRDRQFIVVRDSEGRGVPGCEIAVESSKASLTLRTRASGRALLFPHAEGVAAPFRVSARCGGLEARASVASLKQDAVIRLDLAGTRDPLVDRGIDVAFVLDTTASMHGEIEAVKAAIQKVSEAIKPWKASIRVGLVEYRDRSDAFTTRVHPFSGGLEAFGQRIASVRAGEGGDDPEAVDAGLHAALSGLDWGERAVRVAFLVGDAPPHLGEVPPDGDYAAAARRASRMGVALHTVAASGMNPEGQLVFRQIAQFTGASSLHILRRDDPFDFIAREENARGCEGGLRQYTTGNLDQVLLGKIGQELTALDADPLAIAGLGRDEPLPRCDPPATALAAARP